MIKVKQNDITKKMQLNIIKIVEEQYKTKKSLQEQVNYIKKEIDYNV